jgi:hypothetical protein
VPSARYRTPRCSICRLANRAQVEGPLALGLSCQAVATKFGLSEDAVWRHRRAHMDVAHTAALLLGRKAADIDIEALQRSEGDRLLAEIVDQRVRLRAVRDMALNQGALGFVFMAESSIRSCLQFEAQLLAPILAQRLQAKDVSGKTISRIERIIIEGVSPKERAADPEAEPLEAERLEPALPADPVPLEPAPLEPAPLEPKPLEHANVVRLDEQRAPLFGFAGNKGRT